MYSPGWCPDMDYVTHMKIRSDLHFLTRKVPKQLVPSANVGLPDAIPSEHPTAFVRTEIFLGSLTHTSKKCQHQDLWYQIFTRFARKVWWHAFQLNRYMSTEVLPVQKTESSSFRPSSFRNLPSIRAAMAAAASSSLRIAVCFAHVITCSTPFLRNLPSLGRRLCHN